MSGKSARGPKPQPKTVRSAADIQKAYGQACAELGDLTTRFELLKEAQAKDLQNFQQSIDAKKKEIAKVLAEGNERAALDAATPAPTETPKTEEATA
jgi:hypothetical protein